jgi:hypothetical protein
VSTPPLTLLWLGLLLALLAIVFLLGYLAPS